MEDRGPQTLEALEQRLSQPSQQAIQTMQRVSGDVILLGAGGKMGPTLARMARRAADEVGTPRRVIAASRFSDASVRQRLESWGVETRVVDLLDESSVSALPEVENVIFMTGMKFGAAKNPALTWAMNCYAPSLVCRHFQHSRIVAFSSGNVYDMVPVASGGSRETDNAAPRGEYAMTVLGRERMFQHFSQQQNLPLALLRLNYAMEMRYGVLVDIAGDVLAGRPIDVTTGAFNVIWQGEANAMTLAALEHVAVGGNVINLAGKEILRTRDVAERFGRLMNKPVAFVGQEAETAYLSNGANGYRLLGEPEVTADEMIRWVADWMSGGRETLGKPTHFQVRSGKF